MYFPLLKIRLGYVQLVYCSKHCTNFLISVMLRETAGVIQLLFGSYGLYCIIWDGILNK